MSRNCILIIIYYIILIKHAFLLNKSLRSSMSIKDKLSNGNINFHIFDILQLLK